MKRVLSPTSVCIDVGANVGSILDQMIALAPEGLHLAVEPIPEMADGLRKKYEGRANVVVVEAALGDASGIIPFHFVRDRPGWSGILRSAGMPPTSVVEVIQVDVKRLDDVAADRDVDLIKIDVEGAEFRVFDGAARTIARCRPEIVFEHGLGGRMSTTNSRRRSCTTWWSGNTASASR